MAANDKPSKAEELVNLAREHFAALGKPEPSPRGPRRALFPSPRFLRWFRWCQIIAGWVLVALFLAGVTGIARRE